MNIRPHGQPASYRLFLCEKVELHTNALHNLGYEKEFEPLWHPVSQQLNGKPDHFILGCYFLRYNIKKAFTYGYLSRTPPASMCRAAKVNKKTKHVTKLVYNGEVPSLNSSATLNEQILYLTQQIVRAWCKQIQCYKVDQWYIYVIPSNAGSCAPVAIMDGSEVCWSLGILV